MPTSDQSSLAELHSESSLDEPENPLRHYASVLRRRARFSLISIAIGLLLGLVASFFIKQGEVKTHYFKAMNTLVLSADSTGGSNDSGYSLPRAAQLVQDKRLIAVSAKKVGWDSVETGNHLAAVVRPESGAIDVIGIAKDAKTAETLANTAAATLARMADQLALQSFQTRMDDLAEQQDDLQAQVDVLAQDPAQQAQLTIAQSQLNNVKSQIASLGTAPATLGLTTAQDAHAVEINSKAYKQRLENAINLPGQLQQTNSVTNPSDEAIDETDLSRPRVPNRFELILIGGAIGLVIGIIISFIIEAWDDKVRSRARVEALCDLPVIAEIPSMGADEAATHAIAMVDSPKSPIAERYRSTCTAALFALGESATERPSGGPESGRSNVPVILVTSPNPGEGKTTTSANIAAAFADTGRRVLAVDADFRRPALAKFMVPIANLNDPHGPAATRIDNVSFLAAPHTSGAVGDTVFALRKLIAHHQHNYDIVIVDTPPMLTTNDAIDLLAAADATILVFRAGRTRTNSAQRAATVLSRLRADVLGVVLNGCDRKEMENYYGYGYGYGEGYYYYYGEDHDAPKKKRRGKSSARSDGDTVPAPESASDGLHASRF